MAPRQPVDCPEMAPRASGTAGLCGSSAGQSYVHRWGWLSRRGYVAKAIRTIHRCEVQQGACRAPADQVELPMPS